MSLFCALASGSSGNCFYLKSGETSLLIDLGISCRSATQGLGQLGACPQELSGILLTHEHSDHIKGLPVFLKKNPVPVYGPAAVLEHLERNVALPAHARLVPVEGDFMLGQLAVRPFLTQHDSAASFGYRMTGPDGATVGLATDLGCYTEPVHQGLSGCDLVVLESNYDEGMILASSYPYYLKRRIQSPYGHLSNSECAQALCRLAQEGTRRFLLCHLSQNNNLPILAHQASASALEAAGFAPGQAVQLQVAQRSQLSQPVWLRESPAAQPEGEWKEAAALC